MRNEVGDQGGAGGRSWRPAGLPRPLGAEMMSIVSQGQDHCEPRSGIVRHQLLVLASLTSPNVTYIHHQTRKRTGLVV